MIYASHHKYGRTSQRNLLQYKFFFQKILSIFQLYLIFSQSIFEILLLIEIIYESLKIFEISLNALLY